MSLRRCMNIVMILGVIIADMVFALTTLPVMRMLRDVLVIIIFIQHAIIAYRVQNINCEQEINWE